jgi:UDP-N-acetylglucosamine acyltransferase
VTIGARTQLGGHVEIGDHSIIVEGTALHQFTRIGRLCCLESGARKDIPPFALYVGREGDFDGTVAGANRKGMEDAGFSPKTIGAIERASEILLDSGLNTTQAAQAIGTELAGSPEAAEIVAFLAGSKRGLARGGKR